MENLVILQKYAVIEVKHKAVLKKNSSDPSSRSGFFAESGSRFNEYGSETLLKSSWDLKNQNQNMPVELTQVNEMSDITEDGCGATRRTSRERMSHLFLL